MPTHRDLPDGRSNKPRKPHRSRLQRGVRHRGYGDAGRLQRVIGLLVVAVVAVGYFAVNHPQGPFSFLAAGPKPAFAPQIGLPGVSPSSPGEGTRLHGARALLLPTGPAQAVTGTAAIVDLNRQRRLNGLAPLSAVKQRFASAWCPDEDHGPSGGELYRDWSQYLTWDATMTPWDGAPAHQISLYHPLVSAAGATDVGGSACLGLGDPAATPTAPTFSAYTSTTGRNDVPPVEVVSGERPYAPQELVGLAQGRPTGPQLILYAEGFAGESQQAPVGISWVRLQTARGQRVSGVRFVDSRVAAGHANSGLFRDAAVIIPPELREATGYTLRVAWRGPTGQTGVQTVAVATGSAPGLQASVQRGAIYVSSRSPQPIYLSEAARGRGVQRRAALGSGHGTSISFKAGVSTEACLYQPPGNGYTAGTLCFGLTSPVNTQAPYR